MKRFTQTLVLGLMAALVAFGTMDEINAQTTQHGPGFIDENGDGINDNALDADGDGIPNGQDPDYTKPQDGSGRQAGRKGQSGLGQYGPGFIDEDGDGICDYYQDADGDGIPNCQDPDWTKPLNGTGNQHGKMKAGRQGNNGAANWGNGQKSGHGSCDGNGLGRAKAKNTAAPAK
ncbi:hypothetical protein L0128_03445 [candidate division KSB1 bacterium]|nr:hypothetical protein [candidate division KSB1 bacterium]